MSRPSPRIEQSINGKKVEWWEILPIYDADGIRYESSYKQKCNQVHIPIGFDLLVSAYFPDCTLKWENCYYSKEYIPFLETDVQDTFPVDFLIEGVTVVVKHEYYDEHQGIFIIDKETGKLIQ